MKKKEKTKRLGIILLEFVFLIAILIGIVKLNANANNGPEMNRIKALSNVSDARSALENKFPGYMAVSPELKSVIKTLSLKEVSNTLPQISGHESFQIYAEPTSLDYALRLDWGRIKFKRTEALSGVFTPSLQFSKYDREPGSEFSDSIPVVSQPVHHKYLAPRIVLGIGKR